MKISVVTTVYNRPEHLRLLVAALAAQTRPPDEIVVADDGSAGATVAAVERLRAAAPLPVRVVRQAKDGYRLAAARRCTALAARIKTAASA